MAGRPRLYATNAERMSAFRARQNERLVLADRLTFEQTQVALRRLMASVHKASRSGDLLAGRVDASTYLELLDGLSAHFEEVGASCPLQSAKSTGRARSRRD